MNNLGLSPALIQAENAVQLKYATTSNGTTDTQEYSFANVVANIILPFIRPGSSKPPMVSLPGLSIVSISEHRDKYPVTGWGLGGIKGFTDGRNLCAGSLGFVNLGINPFTQVIKEFSLFHPQGFTPNEYISPTQLPFMDLSLVFLDDGGKHRANILIKGMTIVDSAAQVGVDIVRLTESYGFMAKSITTLLVPDEPVLNQNTPTNLGFNDPFLTSQPSTLTLPSTSITPQTQPSSGGVGSGSTNVPACYASWVQGHTYFNGDQASWLVNNISYNYHVANLNNGEGFTGGPPPNYPNIWILEGTCTGYVGPGCLDSWVTCIVKGKGNCYVKDLKVDWEIESIDNTWEKIVRIRSLIANRLLIEYASGHIICSETHRFGIWEEGESSRMKMAHKLKVGEIIYNKDNIPNKITSISKIGKGLVWEIALEGPTHLYIAGDLIHHNPTNGKT